MGCSFFSSFVVLGCLISTFLLILLSSGVDCASEKVVVMPEGCAKHRQLVERCTSEARIRYGTGQDLRTWCCVEKKAIECQESFLNQHCEQHKDMATTELLKRMKKDLQETCGPADRLCSSDLASVWFYMILTIIAIIVGASLLIIAFIYFSG